VSQQNFAADYINVAQRIAAFHEKYPDGSLQSEILTLNDHEVLIRAQAFRTPDDARPGIGHAREPIPGSTPYTRGSEVENAQEAPRAPQRPAPVSQPAPQRTEPQRPPEQQRPAAAPAPAGGITLGQALEALAGIDKKAISDKGKELYGQWSLKAMTPEQRAHVVEELVGRAPSLSGPPDDMWDGVEVAA